MKRTRHTYHYTVRRLKRNKVNIQKNKLAAKFLNNKEFWRDIKTINAANKTLPTIIDSKEGISEITHIFKNKYEALYTSVPTSDTELSSINAEIDNRINCYNVRDIVITPAHINTYFSTKE